MADVDELLGELKQKRDELRVRMHLASKEAQQEWDELEHKMEKFVAEARLRETGKGLGSALGQLGNEIKQGYRHLRDALKD